MELPKRARTVNWESGVLTLDGEKQFEVPELTVEIMEQLAGYTLVGFHVKSYPVTDELLAPFAGHKKMCIRDRCMLPLERSGLPILRTLNFHSTQRFKMNPFL